MGVLEQLVFEKEEEVWEYVRGCPTYVAVERAMNKDGKKVYVARRFDEVCRLQSDYQRYGNVHHYTLRGVGRLVLMLKRQGMSLQKLYDEYAGQPWIVENLEEVLAERERVREKFYGIFETHPVAEWTLTINGLGKHSVIMFLGFIDPHVCSTAGKACAFWALAGPSSRRVSGRKGVGNPRLRGEAFFMAKRVWMKGDSYYKPLAEAKKEWYLAKLPDERGKKAHAHVMALLWLGHLLVSHAWEVWRRYEGLPVHSHRLYIPPKPHEDAVFDDERILECLRTGRVE